MTTKNKTSLVEAMSKTKDQTVQDITNKKNDDKMKQIIINVSPEVHYQLKRLAVDHRSKIQTLAREAFNDLLVKYKLPPIM
jgi:hypothetical protein